MTALTEYIADPVRRANLARALDSSPQYLWQIATRWRGKRPSPRLAKRIEDATAGEVTRHDLRPDLFDPPAAPAPVSEVA